MRNKKHGFSEIMQHFSSTTVTELKNMHMLVNAIFSN